MALPTFTPTIAPSPGTGRTPEIRILRSSFGDGYSQDAPDGLNHIRQVLTLKWDALPLADMLALRAFFEDRGGYRAFWYQPHSFPAPLKWTCREWSDSGDAPFAFSAKLTQSFTLEV